MKPDMRTIRVKDTVRWKQYVATAPGEYNVPDEMADVAVAEGKAEMVTERVVEAPKPLKRKRKKSIKLPSDEG